MEEGTFYGLTMKTPVIYAEIQVLLMLPELLLTSGQISQKSGTCFWYLDKCIQMASGQIQLSAQLGSIGIIWGPDWGQFGMGVYLVLFFFHSSFSASTLSFSTSSSNLSFSC